MKNSNIKEQFIDLVLETTPYESGLIKRVFKYAETYEEQYNKDICNWNMNEILNFYRSLNCKSGLSIYNYNSRLKKYVLYCMEHNLVDDLMNHFDEINDDLVFSCINTVYESMTYTREELLNIIDSSLINACDKYLLLAAFEGLLIKDRTSLCTITVDDLDGNKITLKDGRVLTISDELKDLIIQSCEQYSYYGTDKTGSLYTKDFKPDDKNVIKRFTNAYTAEANYERLVNVRMTKLSKMIENEITGDTYHFNYKSLQNAGRIEMIKQIMKEKNISYDDAISDPDVEYRYGHIQSKKLFKLKYPNILGEC